MALELQTQFEDYKVNKDTSKNIATAYSPFVKEFNESKDEAFSIVVNDINDIEGMQKAKEMRKKLQRIRIDLEAKRKEIKEYSLRTGKAIDGLASFITAAIVDAEKHVERQEKFAIEKENERIRGIMDTRINSLMPYLEEGKDPRTMFKLESLSDEDFNTLLDYTKEQWEKAEAIRIQKEKEAEQEAEKERERLRKIEEDNAKLRKEAEEAREREKIKAKEQEAELEKIRAEEKKKQDAINKKHAAEQAKRDKELQEEREKARKLQQEKEEADKKEREKQEAEQKEKKRLARAGDIEKLKHWTSEIRKVGFPSLNNKEMEQWIIKNTTLILERIEAKINDSN